jgi:putative PIN family toxin of toxin-antitoxin system
MDTNVLVSALRSRVGASFAIVQALRRGEWRCVLSNHLLLEYEEKLMAVGKALGISAAEVDGILTVLCAQAEEWQLRPHWHPLLLNDPDDEPLAQLAYESGAALIITHNIRHLKPAEGAGIMVLLPREFLVKLSSGL